MRDRTLGALVGTARWLPLAALAVLTATASKGAEVPEGLLVEVGEGDFQASESVESAGAGVSIVSALDSDDLTVAIANARAKANQIYKVQAGAWISESDRTIATEADSTSALCFAYLGEAAEPSAVAVNQHGEPNRYYKGSASFAAQEQWEWAGEGDNYDCRFGDYSGDGRLDLAISDLKGGVRVLRSRADGSLERPIKPDGMDEGPSGAVSWIDVDLDGDLDLFVTSPVGANSLYRNDEGVLSNSLPGTLGELGQASGMWVGASWADYDNDGDFDVFLTNLKGSNALFQNSYGVFRRTGSILDEDLGESWVGVWGDYNHDGRLDLYVTSFDRPDTLYLGHAEGDFVKASAAAVGTVPEASIGSSGVARADLDKDGDLDLVIAHWEGSANRVLVSTGSQQGNWLEVRLSGSRANPEAVGARVILEAKIRGETVRQTRVIGGGDGIRSQSWHRAHFGLADTQLVDRLEVHWPDGTSAVSEKIEANRAVRFVKRDQG